MSPVRFAAIADIHGNAAALSAVLADIKRNDISQAVNLGDHFSGPLEAGKTAEILLDYPMISIRGNHDRWLSELQPEDMGPSDRVAYDQLLPQHRDWLDALPPTGVFLDEVFLCHGTPSSDTSYWLEAVDENAQVRMAALTDIEVAARDVDFPLILCGHTHIPRSVRLLDGRLVVNPGSVGCPGYDDDMPVFHVMQTGTPLASYAILERTGDDWSVTFRQVPYDNAAMARLAADRGRPEWASALATGWVTMSRPGVTEASDTGSR